jgi:hypothetical protein
MPSPVTHHLAVRRLAAAAIAVAACLPMAGCGGSSHSSTHKNPSGITPIGPADLGANVTGLMATHQRYLKHVKVKCPSGPVTKFPVFCHFTATQVAAIPGTKKQNFPGPYRVAGSIKVFGVYFRTKTYEYALNYVPTH